MDELAQRLAKYTPLKIELKLNQSKSLFMSIQRKRREIVFMLHQFFLSAPEAVLKALVQYAVHKRAEDMSIIKRFVYTKQNELDLSHTVNEKKLISKGEYFDLKEICAVVNEKYFQNQMQVQIAWFYPRYRTYRAFTFGQYDRCLKLIKINHHLDREDTPLFYMECLIHHEMLHEHCAPYVDEKGRYRVHTKEFKRLERAFPFFHEAKGWEKKFLKNFWRLNGRS